MSKPHRPVAAVGVVCLRGDEVLLIRRGKPPRLGEWSLPGGRIEWGERAADAALRELREETGVEAQLTGLVAVVDGLFGFGEDGSEAGGEAGEEPRHYLLIDYASRWLSGDPVAGDDAAEARWWPLAAVGGLGMWSETVRVIREATERSRPEQVEEQGHGGVDAAQSLRPLARPPSSRSMAPCAAA